MKVIHIIVALALLIGLADAGTLYRPDQINTSLPFPSITIDEGENITLDGGQIWNYTNRGIDSASLGAIGDGVTDDTAALQNVLDYAAANKTRAIITGISGSDFRITDELVIPSGTDNNLVIDGLSSWTNILADLPAGKFAFTDNGSQVGGLVIQNLDIKPYGTNYDAGGINLSNTLRGAEIRNVRVFGLQNGIKLYGSIYGQTILSGVGCYLSPLNNSTGLEVDGNAVFCYGLEILGYAQGVNWTGTLGCINGGNIAGSPGYVTNESIVFDDAEDITVQNVWIEDLNESKYGTGLARAIEVTNSDNIRLVGTNFAAGCLYIHSGTVHSQGSSFKQGNGDGGYGKITVLDGGWLVSENTLFDPATTASYGHAALSTGNISACSGFDGVHGTTGRFYLPLLNSNLVWIFETNVGMVDLTYDTSDYLTGNKSANITTTGAYQGIYFNATGLPKNTPCTVTAMVKTSTADAQIYITNVAATDTSEDYTGPGQSVKNAGNNWRRISSTLKTTTGRIDARIISTTAAVFKVDSINVYAGVVDYAPY